ncbi:MAG TPA: hypothetical protein ENN41_01415 [Sediminispirochaeta sp.]|nr:hypothetical protein [Sediminispirochaeta sp.]
MQRRTQAASQARRGTWPAVLLVLVLATPGLWAQSDDEGRAPDDTTVAILERGPVAERGLPFLPRNVISHYRGYYSLEGDAIKVYYTEQEIVRFSRWPAVDCGPLQLYQVEGEVYFGQFPDFYIFVEFEQSLRCDFVNQFISRLNYFRSVQDMNAGRPPFPAILEWR